MKHLLLTFLVACSNDAITYVKAIHPDATCVSIKTSMQASKPDIAICTLKGGEIWECRVDDYKTDCKKVGHKPVLAEQPQ